MPPTVTLADELLLLAYDDTGGRAPRGCYLDLGLGGALLAELALAGRVDLVAGKVRVLDERPVGDPLADALLQRIAADPRRRTANRWVERAAKGLRPQLLDRLVAAGTLARRERRVLGLVPVTRFPAVVAGSSLGHKAEARARVAAAVLDSREPSPRTAALVGLVLAVNLRGAVLPGAPRRGTERRMAEISTGQWVADGVRRAVRDTQSASSAGGVAAVVAGASVAS